MEEIKMIKSENIQIIPLNNVEIVIKNKNMVNNQLIITKNQIEELIILLEESKNNITHS
jgi:hypothetical protein